MSTVKFEHADELKKALARLSKNAAGAVLRDAALDGAKVLQQAANADAPGPHIETDVVSVSKKQVVIAVGPDKEHWYYQFLETGSPPHTIMPSEKSALRWPDGDEAVFTSVVKHPGMAARPFLRPAIDEHWGAAVNAAGASLRRRLGIG